MNETDKRIQALQDAMRSSQEELNALKKAREEEKAPKPWKPNGGGWSVGGDGECFSSADCEIWSMHGSECQTREQAEELSKARKVFQWMCQLAFELNPSGKLGGNYYVSLRGSGGYFFANSLLTADSIDAVFETHEAAKKAAEIMNRDPDNWKFYQ